MCGVGLNQLLFTIVFTTKKKIFEISPSAQMYLKSFVSDEQYLFLLELFHLHQKFCFPICASKYTCTV